MSGALALELNAAAAALGESGGATDNSGSLSLQRLSELAESISKQLKSHGCERDEPVAVFVSNRARDMAALWGVWLAGAVAAPVHRTSPEPVVLDLVARLNARFVVDTEPDHAFSRSTNWGQRKNEVTALDRPIPPVRPVLKDAALIVFTSGTTGLPKGAVVSHRAISGKLAANNSILHFGPETRTLLVLQITFSFGMWVSLLTLTRGGWLRMEEKFEAGRLLPVLVEGGITDVALVPTMIRAMYATKQESELVQEILALGGMPHLRHLLTGGENLGPALGRKLIQLFPTAQLFDIYGLAETSTCDFFLMPAEGARLAGCIGRPAPGVAFRIIADTGQLPRTGDAGELQIRTPYLMNGYLDAPDLTAAALSDGYFRTGDIAREREPGVVELVGRSKDLIFRGANKVSPLEIEHVLAGHPAVAEVLACGVPDALHGERIHVLVVLRGGITVKPEELQAWAAMRLERYKVPDRVHFGTELPLGRTGKSDRTQLRKTLTERN